METYLWNSWKHWCEISTTEVKDIYLCDVSIQYYVLKNLGFKIKSANVICNCDSLKEEVSQVLKILNKE